jgi:hypothetical protein
MIHVRPRKLTCPVRSKILFFLCREACFGPAMGNFVWGFMCEDREGRQPSKGNSSCNGKPEIQFRKDTRLLSNSLPKNIPQLKTGE